MTTPTIAEIAREAAAQIEKELDPCLIGNEIEGLIRIITRAIERATKELADDLKEAKCIIDVQHRLIASAERRGAEKAVGENNQLREQNAALEKERDDLHAGLIGADIENKQLREHIRQLEMMT